MCDLIQQCDTIDDKLKEGDKNILIDGFLDLYSSPEQRVENLRAEIPVQVKGTMGKLKPNKHGVVKFMARAKALKRYRDVYYGVLLFVVGVNKNSRLGEDVFFAQLLPYNINCALSKTCPNQEKTSVPIKPFPTNPKEMTRIITALNANRKKQMKAKVVAYDFDGDTKTLPEDINSISVSTQLYKGERVTTIAGLENAYVYGKDMEGQLVVLGKIEDVAMFARGAEVNVASGDFELTTLLMLGDHREGTYIEFEGVSMILRDDHRVTLSFGIKGPIRRRYNTARFVHEFMRTGELRVEGKTLLRTKIESDPDLEMRLDEDVCACGEFVETLGALSIAVDWDSADMTTKELNDLALMHRLLVEGKPWAGQDIESPIVHFDIQGCRVYALVRKCGDGSYAFTGLDSDQLCFSFSSPDEKEPEVRGPFEPVPAAMVLGKDDLQKAVNLDLGKFDAQFDRFPVTVGNQTPLNQKLLDMLTAYDEGARQPQGLLACAAVLARRLHEFDQKSQTYLLNLLQTIGRKREFNEEEKSALGKR
ncbi:hypothetical protein [Atopobium sp. oral taxon 416]|uniref:hypothetical protein n=1 Tax=Atopobium sp. oral taxon 416 TaxID=712157 RepID=UPI001BA5CDC8|nr:hypothetical protein [Atopobium sp. oral taxon 416]QUC04353.1 hypothetical protein J4859_05320 [Atopobium sp. oral taxon 416]